MAGRRPPDAVGLHHGPPRANRKPILQLLDSRSRDLAFVKVGSRELTRPLVVAEGNALGRLSTAGLRRVVVPAVLHAESWQGSQLLVLAPVATTSSAQPRLSLLAEAMVEVCGCVGRASQPLAMSDYWGDLGQRLKEIDGPMAAPLRQIRRDLETPAHHSRVGLGAWHGDWTPWNMSWSLDQVVVWDWERFALGVPAGFDALHFELQSTIRRGGVEPRQAIGRLIGRAPELLVPFGVAPSEFRLLVSTYLLELATRYVHDRQDQAGARLGDIGSWLLPELGRLTSDVATGQPR